MKKKKAKLQKQHQQHQPVRIPLASQENALSLLATVVAGESSPTVSSTNETPRLPPISDIGSISPTSNNGSFVWPSPIVAPNHLSSPMLAPLTPPQSAIKKRGISSLMADESYVAARKISFSGPVELNRLEPIQPLKPTKVTLPSIRKVLGL
jgi:hypothetical protein